MQDISPEHIARLDETSIQETLTDALAKLLKNIDLTPEQMRQVMLIIMQGRCPDALMGAILIALRQKGESIDEISTCAKTMIELADTIDIQDKQAVDIVGTGGDGSNLFNVSTASALVAAAAGVTVAKHGNRGVSTTSGSSDLLAQAGLRLDASKQVVQDCINQLGIGFLFAPNHHPAMKNAVHVRRTLKVRTIFNILGPLTNPALVKRAVVGVFTPELCQPLAHVFDKLGYEHVLVVHSEDGLDEYSLAAGTYVAELKNGQVNTYITQPEDLGIDSKTLKGLMVESSAQSFELICQALSGQDSTNQAIQKARDIIAINAGAAIYVAGLADSHAQGVAKAYAAINSGQGLQKLHKLAAFTQQNTP